MTRSNAFSSLLFTTTTTTTTVTTSSQFPEMLEINPLALWKKGISVMCEFRGVCVCVCVCVCVRERERERKRERVSLFSALSVCV